MKSILLVLFVMVTWKRWVPHKLGIHGSLIVGDESNTQHNSAFLCVDITKDDSLCTNDPNEALKRIYNKNTMHGFHMGVTQTIDGTEEEKNNIRKVIQLMDRYWHEEILSNVEYEDVRSSWYVSNQVKNISPLR
jgi:hypothetical protein